MDTYLKAENARYILVGDAGGIATNIQLRDGTTVCTSHNLEVKESVAPIKKRRDVTGSVSQQTKAVSDHIMHGDIPDGINIEPLD